MNHLCGRGKWSSDLGERILQLEDALAIFQASASSERHPLLRDELLAIKFGPERNATTADSQAPDPLSNSLDAIGTLTIGEHGEAKYFGRSGGSEVSCLPYTRVYSTLSY